MPSVDHISLLIVRETWSHMSSVSGFDPLFEAISQHVRSTKSIFVPSSNPKRSLSKSIFRRLCGTRQTIPPVQPPSPFVQARHEEATRKLLKEAGNGLESLIFLSAAENQYGGWLASAPRQVRQRMVLFMHQPPAWLKLNWCGFDTLHDLRAIVCLCSDQAEYIKSITNTPVIQIKHGVCLDFFRPPLKQQPSQPLQLLFVGQWLRDFETLEKAFAIAHRKRPGLKMDCVVPRRARNNSSLLKLARDPSTRWHADISSEELLRLYQNATLLFLPVLDATANNAILEALACGLPIVSTDVGGISEYLPEGAGELCTIGDPYSHAETVLKWLDDAELRKTAETKSRSAAEEDLNWSHIARSLIDAIN